jgi:hypothetical protein
MNDSGRGVGLGMIMVWADAEKEIQNVNATNRGRSKVRKAPHFINTNYVLIGR